MKNVYICFFALTLFMSANAQTPPHYGQAVPTNKVYKYAWTKAKWQGDDRPYLAVRKRITEALKAGKSPDKLLAQYKKEYEQKPADNLRLFAWACAVVLPLTMHIINPGDANYVNHFDLAEAYEKSKPPYTYEFMRMRYLAVEQGFDRNDYTTALGERLAAYDKNDFDVICYACADIWTNIPGAQEKSLGYAHRLIELDPNCSTGYGLLAERHYHLWAYFGKKSEDAQQSIHWNEEYLKREKRTGAIYVRGREVARLEIEKLQKWLAEHK